MLIFIPKESWYDSSNSKKSNEKSLPTLFLLDNIFLMTITLHTNGLEMNDKLQIKKRFFFLKWSLRDATTLIRCCSNFFNTKWNHECLMVSNQPINHLNERMRGDFEDFIKQLHIFLNPLHKIQKGCLLKNFRVQLTTYSGYILNFYNFQQLIIIKSIY